MFLSRRDPLGSHGSHNTTLDIVFIVAVSVLVTLLCTVAILHCILRRQRRQSDDQGSPHTLHFAPGSQGRNNGTVAPGRSPSSPQGFEKASKKDLSNQPTIACPITPYLPLSKHHIYRPAT